MKKCYDCTHVEMCGWRREVKEQGCEFFDDGPVWIPVSERLPRNNGWYLVTIRGYETVTDVSLYSADGSAWSDVSTKQKVIAWMPLPEPYDCGAKMKGGEDE